MALEPIPLPGNQASVQGIQAPRPAPIPVAQPVAVEPSDPQGNHSPVQGHGTAKTSGKEARLTPPAEANRTPPRNFLIEVPPQQMSPDEGLPNK
jgi:hypothetical protein